MIFSNRLEQLSKKIHDLFSQDTVKKIACDTGFIRRPSRNKINPLDFVLLIVGHLTRNSLCSLAGMTDILSQMSGSQKISPQGLSQRINSKNAVRFLKKFYSKFLHLNSRKTMSSLQEKGLLKGFKRVFLEDSTSCELNEKVSHCFKGCGGSSYKAGYKIHLIWNALAGNIQSLNITGSNVTDQSMADRILKILQAGDLIIRDLGYFSLSILSQIAEKKGYFLSRLKRQVNIYTLEGKRIRDLPKYIDQYYPDNEVVRIKVLLGKKQQLEVFLCAYRVPKEVINQRIRKQRKVANKNGYTLSKSVKSWSKFTFLITNVGEKRWNAEVLVSVYKLRWEIELVFKSWKSITHIDLIKGESQHRVQCFILGRLIAILIMAAFFSRSKEYMDHKYKRELSLYKFMSWFVRGIQLLIIPCIEIFEKELQKNIFDLCKQKRRRRTSVDFLYNSAKYAELYSEDTQYESFRKIA
jgi:hypothetical protein